jgi:hypothetical protein
VLRKLAGEVFVAEQRIAGAFLQQSSFEAANNNTSNWQQQVAASNVAGTDTAKRH